MCQQEQLQPQQPTTRYVRVQLDTLEYLVKQKSTNVNRIRASTEYAVMKLADTLM